MTVRIINAHVLDGLAQLEDESVHCVVTSPPYFGLRDYGIEPQVWGGDSNCAWRGDLGLEPTPTLYVEHLVAVFAEVKRVLRSDGTLWVVIGDSYAAGGNGGHQKGPAFHGHGNRGASDLVGRAKKAPAGLKPKDLIGIPWRLAFALQDDGWYLRRDIIWSKPNPMPESVADRCTSAHEYVFHLSKSERYFYDADAIKDPTVSLDPRHPSFRPNSVEIASNGRKEFSAKHKMSARSYSPEGRNKRSVWSVPTVPSSTPHYATYPPALIEPCILAGCPVGGTVLDPFIGVGTTAIVAERLARNCIGIKLSPKYAATAERRAREPGFALEFAEAAE